MIAFSILFAIAFLFMFYTSGIAIVNFLKIRLVNTYIAIAIGFFAYFSFLSIVMFPMQFLVSLPYYALVYIGISLTIFYLLADLVILKFWISSTPFSLNSLRYFIIVVISFLSTFAVYSFFSQKSFDYYAEVLYMINWASGNNLSFINDSPLFSFFGFKPLQSWYLVFEMFINLTSASKEQYKGLIVVYSYIIDSFLISSIIMSVHTTFCKVRSRKLDNILLIIMSLVFITLKNIFSISDNAIWSEQMIFMYLIIFVTVMLINYITFEYRIVNYPILIGFILSGYTAFSWDSSFLVIFLIFVSIFALQQRYSTSWFKDIVKIGIFPIIAVGFFSIVMGLVAQAIFVLVLAAAILIMTLIMNKRYKNTFKLESFVSKNYIFTALLIPSLFTFLSIILLFATKQDFSHLIGSYLTFVDRFFAFIPNEDAQYWIIVTVSLGLVVLCVIWIIFRSRLGHGIVPITADLFVINYLTFYNPLVINFINYIYSPLIDNDGVIMLVMLITLVVSVIYNYINKLSFKKNNSQKLKINKLPVYIYVS